MLHKRYNDSWDKQRLIDACVEMSDNNGYLLKITKDSCESDQIKRSRIESVLKVYNISYDSLTTYNGYGNLVSATISDEAISELNSILGKYIFPSRRPIQLTDHWVRKDIFDNLFMYRAKINIVNKCWEDVIEASRGGSVVYQFVNREMTVHFQKVFDKVEHVLILLMGNYYETPIPVNELIEKYGYPKTTDDELFDIEVDERF